MKLRFATLVIAAGLSLGLTTASFAETFKLSHSYEPSTSHGTQLAKYDASPN